MFNAGPFEFSIIIVASSFYTFECYTFVALAVLIMAVSFPLSHFEMFKTCILSFGPSL